MTTKQQKRMNDARINMACQAATTNLPVPIRELSNICKAAASALIAGADDAGMAAAARCYAETVSVKV